MYGYIVNQLSEFGIDPDTDLPTVSDKYWKEFIKSHPEAGRLKVRPSPFSEDLQTLFASKVAMGQLMISSTGATKRKQEDEIVLDDFKRPTPGWALMNSSQHLSEIVGRPVWGSIPNQLHWYPMYPYIV